MWFGSLDYMASHAWYQRVHNSTLIYLPACSLSVAWCLSRGRKDETLTARSSFSAVLPRAKEIWKEYSVTTCDPTRLATGWRSFSCAQHTSILSRPPERCWQRDVIFKDDVVLFAHFKKNLLKNNTFFPAEDMYLMFSSCK